MKGSDMFESYLKSVCTSKAQFEAVQALHRIYFEDQECDFSGEECTCDGKPCGKTNCKCDDGVPGDVKCECGGNEDNGKENSPMINESTDTMDDGISTGDADIEDAAKATGMSPADYASAVSLFVS